MGKRFTDTMIWERDWYLDLLPEEKCALNYIKDNCDNVGVWPCAFKKAETLIGKSINWDAFPSKCHDNIMVLNQGKKWWVTDFCQFQYGDLKPECRPHRSYIELLKKHGLWDFYLSIQKGKKVGFGEGYPYPTGRVPIPPRTRLDKDKEEDTLPASRISEVTPTEAIQEIPSTKVDTLIKRLHAIDPGLPIPSREERARLEGIQDAEHLTAVFEYYRQKYPSKPARFVMKDFLDNFTSFRADWKKSQPTTYTPPPMHKATAEDDAAVALAAARGKRRMKIPLSEEEKALLGETAPAEDRFPDAEPAAAEHGVGDDVF